MGVAAEAFSNMSFLKRPDPEILRVGDIEPLQAFHPAETYHQDYFRNHPNQPYCQAIIAPKVEAVDQIRELESLMAELERRRKISSPLRIVAAIESAIGLLGAADIARASSRICGLMLGAEDLSRDIGLPIRRDAEAHELLYARSAMVIAATAARVQSIDQVWPDIKDVDGLRRDSMQARRLGFSGKALIHPAQIEPVNEAFSPTPDDLQFAREVVEAFRDAESRGLGSVAFGGQLLDKPIVDRAHATIAMGDKLGLAVRARADDTRRPDDASR